MAEVAEKFPPQAPLPPYCVVKNRVLIFKEEGVTGYELEMMSDKFLRTFEEG